MYATFGDEAAIYYFLSSLSCRLPLAAAWMLARYGFPLPAKLQEERGIRLAIQTIVAVPVLAFDGVIIVGENGSDMRGLNVGPQFDHLILFGWLGFPLAGVLFGLCGMYLLAAVRGTRRAART